MIKCIIRHGGTCSDLKYVLIDVIVMGGRLLLYNVSIKNWFYMHLKWKSWCNLLFVVKYVKMYTFLIYFDNNPINKIQAGQFNFPSLHSTWKVYKCTYCIIFNNYDKSPSPY